MSNLLSNSTSAIAAILITALSFNLFIIGPVQAASAGDALVTMAPVLA